MQDRYLDGIVVGRRMLTARIAEYLLGPTEGRSLPIAEAGSHVELRFGGDDGRFLRHYSIVGPLDLRRTPEPFWRIAVQREDRARGSTFIHRAFEIGTRVRMSRPLNGFRLSRRSEHVLLVAGGIGITPIFAMARSLTMRRQAFSILYAGLDLANMAYVEELAAICDGRLTLHEMQHDGVPDLEWLLAAQPERTVAHVCGPGTMIEATIAAGAALGWPPERVRYEVFNVAHRPDDRSFEVHLRSGRRVTVGAGTTILDALEGAGIDTLSDCRRGECGLCATDVLGSDGPLDHRDHFFSGDEHARGRQMTICCSRTRGTVLELDI